MKQPTNIEFWCPHCGLYITDNTHVEDIDEHL